MDKVYEFLLQSAKSIYPQGGEMRKLIAYLFERRFGAFVVCGRTYWRDYGHELENGKGVSRVGKFIKGWK